MTYSLNISDNLISKSLVSWDFDTVSLLKEQRYKMDIMYLPQYCKYLADIGELNKLSSLVKELKSTPIGLGLYSSEQFNICKRLIELDERLTVDITKETGFFAKVYSLTKKGDLKSLSQLLLSDNWKLNVKKDISSEDNMILNYAFNELMSSYYINSQLIVIYLHYIFEAKNINSIRKKNYLYRIINFCGMNESLSTDFFKLKEQYYNHLQKLMSMIHSFSNEDGAKIYMNKLFMLIQNHNNLSLKKNYPNPRVAICISGMSRDDLSGLFSIFQHLVKPLEADVFMHTWDTQQEWIGGARANDRFWFRTFNINELKVPKDLINLDFLCENYPNVHKALITSSYIALDEKKLTSNFNFTRLLVENQEEFIINNKINDNYKSRESFNQIKMFYGMHKVFGLLEQYEVENNFKYDYVIKVRPDLIIKQGISFSDLSKLNESELAVPTGFYGIQDMVFYGPRDIYSQIVSIFNRMLESERLSPLDKFPKYDAHALFFGWMLYKNIRPVLCGIKYNIEEGISNLKVPGLKQALSKDCNIKTRFKYPEETEWLDSFLKNKAK